MAFANGPKIDGLKMQLRRQVQTAVRNLEPTMRLESSAQARAILVQQPAWTKATSILFFAPTPEELDIWPLVPLALAAGKHVALPRFDADSGKYRICFVQDSVTELVPGRFGIREPAVHCRLLGQNSLDLILVPGVAFDLQGRRLGRGKGFFDQLLAGLRGLTCGVAFEEQLVSEVPVAPHDIHLNCILTPKRWLECSPQSRVVVE